MSNVSDESTDSLNFIEEIIEKDIREGTFDGRVQTRFPPEPNGYLHIGHAKAICVSFGLAAKYGGQCNLRFDDTNPEKEEQEYVDAIKEDIKWLGFDWGDREYYASDYFETLYEFAQKLIQRDKAYVDDQSPEQISASRGTPTQPGKPSPFRDRTVEENLDLFERMKKGEFKPGDRVLRAKIDMSSPNMHLRDPIMYRILDAKHHRTGDQWKIYPTYDWAHGQSDSIENVTHSLCSLEFEVHRPLYNWFIEQLEIFPSKQREFARLNLNYTVMSKRKLLRLVKEGYVNGWDDPRMPTLSGMRRRGYTPEAIRKFADRIGVAKRDGVIDFALLEFSVREHLNKIADRKMAVLDPLKLVIENYPEDKSEVLYAINNPEDEESGKREVPFGREVYIDQSDFMIDPPKKFFRLGPGRVVRLKYAYIIECTGYSTDDEGNVTEVTCKYYPESKSGQDTTGIKVKSALSWVPADSCITAQVRQYDRLFLEESPDSDNYIDFLNPASLKTIENIKLEPSVRDVQKSQHIQFERQGYFILDKDCTSEKMIFNRTVTLRDDWAKKQNKR